MMNRITPQVDGNGWCTGFSLIEAEGMYYTLIDLEWNEDGELLIGQLQEWDDETYDEDGTPDGELVLLGKLGRGFDPFNCKDDLDRVVAFLDRASNVEWC